ncbi:MAG: hypothetical protein LBF88_12520 [Planctomycetaceae bacterium]|nr:hypothetical protein [Planctomycetaceae bacterium]
MLILSTRTSESFPWKRTCYRVKPIQIKNRLIRESNGFLLRKNFKNWKSKSKERRQLVFLTGLETDFPPFTEASRLPPTRCFAETSPFGLPQLTTTL